jgi:hypothetical protein
MLTLGASHPTNRWTKLTRTVCLDLSNRRFSCSLLGSILFVVGGLFAVLTLLWRGAVSPHLPVAVHNVSGSLGEDAEVPAHSAALRIVRLERIMMERGIGSKPQKGAHAFPVVRCVWRL